MHVLVLVEERLFCYLKEVTSEKGEALGEVLTIIC
jgi:hypothetical protein